MSYENLSEFFNTLKEEVDVMQIQFLVERYEDVEEIDGFLAFLCQQGGFKKCTVSVETHGLDVPLDYQEPGFLYAPRDSLGPSELDLKNRISNYFEGGWSYSIYLRCSP